MAVQAFSNFRMSLSRVRRQRWRPVRQRRLTGSMQHLWMSSDLCICVHGTFVTVWTCVSKRACVHAHTQTHTTRTHTHTRWRGGRKEGDMGIGEEREKSEGEGGRNMYTFHNFLSYSSFSFSHQHMPRWLSSPLFWQSYLAGVLLSLSTP